jgi:hypothetical protein
MKQNYTHITAIIDRSGSMSTAWRSVQDGYRSLVDENKKGGGLCTFTLIAFDDRYEVPVDFQPITNVSDSLRELKIKPRNMTAFYDAVGHGIDDTEKALGVLPDDLQPEKVLVIIQTDGLNNASKEHTASSVSDLIKSKESSNWEFLFVGVGRDCLDMARSVGVGASNSMAYNPMNTRGALAAVTTKTMAYRMADAHDEVAISGAVSFTDEEREEAVK